MKLSYVTAVLALICFVPQWVLGQSDVNTNTTVEVKSNPPGAKSSILINLGHTPTEQYVKPGSYRLEVRHPNERYLALDTSITVTPNIKNILYADLQKRPLLTSKAIGRIALGFVSVGCHTTNFVIRDMNRAPEAIIFSTGTIALIGLLVLSFF